MSPWRRLRLWLTILAALAAERGAAIDVVSMYRGSCQVDTGVVLRVDNKSVVYLGMSGEIQKIPRYEIVGVASYPLPDLPIEEARVKPGVDAPLYEFRTYLEGGLAPLAEGWPIEYNAEHIQVLTTSGKDHLVDRDDIWGVDSRPASQTMRLAEGEAHGTRYLLRHPLAFEKCPDNVTPGQGEPVRVIPQVTYDNPISIKRYHDHLREGILKIEDYEDRERFYAVPQYYGNRTLLGTWAMIGGRYAQVGSRQVNFLPLVQDEYSDGPFGFQRVVRSGVAPLDWGLHEEPTVQVFYGLKADYVHMEVFFDPTAPLIGSQYNYSKGQLESVDDRLIEKGGLEFGFDVGRFSLYTAFSEGNMAVRANDFFKDNSFAASRTGLSYQYNYYKVGLYAGSNAVALTEDLKHQFAFLKVFARGPLGPNLDLKVQLIERSLRDVGSDPDEPVAYNGESQTVAAEVDWDLNYRWTARALVSVERRTADMTLASGESDTARGVYPKVAGGVTVAF